MILDAHAGSNGARFLSTPWQIMTGFRMHAPTACIVGFPAATSLSKNPLRAGLDRIAGRVGRSRAVRSRGLPAFDSRVRLRTDLPLVNGHRLKRCMRLIRPPGRRLNAPFTITCETPHRTAAARPALRVQRPDSRRGR
jgi:hypothetical protein